MSKELPGLDYRIHKHKCALQSNKFKYSICCPVLTGEKGCQVFSKKRSQKPQSQLGEFEKDDAFDLSSFPGVNSGTVDGSTSFVNWKIEMPV